MIEVVVKYFIILGTSTLVILGPTAIWLAILKWRRKI